MLTSCLITDSTRWSVEYHGRIFSVKVMGFMGKPRISGLAEHMDYGTGILIDRMHGLCLGVAKKHVLLLFTGPQRYLTTQEVTVCTIFIYTSFLGIEWFIEWLTDWLVGWLIDLLFFVLAQDCSCQIPCLLSTANIQPKPGGYRCCSVEGRWFPQLGGALLGPLFERFIGIEIYQALDIVGGCLFSVVVGCRAWRWPCARRRSTKRFLSWFLIIVW